MAKKPSGTTGPFRAETSDAGVSGRQIKIEWPSDPKDIERKILAYFMREFERTGAKFLNVEDGGTQELDFLLTLPGGKVYLELMEAVIPEPGKIPFQPGSRAYYPVPYADSIFREVDKKIAKYGFNHKTPIDLLIYITHEQYSPSESAIQVLRRYFLERKHPFQFVFFLEPSDEANATLWVLFNRDHPLDPPLLSELEGMSWINVVSSGFKVVSMREFKLTKVVHGDTTPNGDAVILVMENDKGEQTTFRIPSGQVDAAIQGLLVLNNKAFERRVAAGDVPKAENMQAPAMIAEDVRVIANIEKRHVVVQTIGRQSTNAPLGLGSFQCGERVMEHLARRLREELERFRQS